MHPVTLRSLALLVLVLAGGLGAAVPAAAATTFTGLRTDQRVVDETGASLTTVQAADLERRLDALVEAGADPVVYVRARDADPDETLDQVEALQQAWVAATDADEDVAVAILINRNPDDPEDARAGVYVGDAYQDGNVPTGEQEAIVEDALVPPLRDGDVHASLVAGVDRLTSDVRDGPQTNAFQDWSAGAAATWVPWVLLALAAVGAVVAGRIFGRRSRLDDPHAWSGQPTVTRPSDLHPAVGAALATGSPQASAVPAVVLDLAARGALDVEQETAGGTFSQATAQVRLLDRSLVRSDVDAAVWDQMAALADDAVVSSKALAKVAANSGPVDEVVRAELVRQGWWDEAAPGARNALAVVGAVAGVLLAVGAVIGASGAEPRARGGPPVAGPPGGSGARREGRRRQRGPRRRAAGRHRDEPRAGVEEAAGGGDGRRPGAAGPLTHGSRVRGRLGGAALGRVLRSVHVQQRYRHGDGRRLERGRWRRR